MPVHDQPTRAPARVAIAALVAAAACWGLGTVVSKQVVDDVAPLTLLPIQLAASSVLLLVGHCGASRAGRPDPAGPQARRARGAQPGGCVRPRPRRPHDHHRQHVRADLGHRTRGNPRPGRPGAAGTHLAAARRAGVGRRRRRSPGRLPAGRVGRPGRHPPHHHVGGVLWPLHSPDQAPAPRRRLPHRRDRPTGGRARVRRAAGQRRRATRHRVVGTSRDLAPRRCSLPECRASCTTGSVSGST